jgi:hypothetical protein
MALRDAARNYHRSPVRRIVNMTALPAADVVASRDQWA